MLLIAEGLNAVIPLIIALILPVLGILCLAWIVLKIAKENTKTVGKIIKWLLIILILILSIWSVMMILFHAGVI